MASSPCSSVNFDSGLEIKTRSVEQTLIPLVSQITTLINHKDKPKKSERTQQAIQRVGQAVSVAVGRFVAVGEAIAVENEELKEEMGMACFEARRAGDAIAQLTDVGTAVTPPVDGRTTVFSDRTGMVKAARMLLSSVTKVLVLADRIVIKQIITSRNKVLVTLEQLERVSTFQEFVQIFSQFGNQMVEFAHLTGDRQNDLKDENKKARMAAARAVLEKCTMMLLTASKTCLRHPDCESARINKDAVFHRMRFALEQVMEIVTDARPCGETKVLPLSIYTGIKDFKSNVEGLREGLYLLPHQALSGQLEAVVERTEDFTDSAYTSHEHREGILQLCQLARQDTDQLITAWMEAQSLNAKEATEEMELSILKTCQSVYELRRELHKVAVGRAADLLKLHAEHLPLRALKASGGEGNLEAVAEYARTLGEQKEQLVETCRLLCHVSGTEPLEITCIHAEETFHVIGPQIISAAQTLALHPSSKIAKENLDVFCEAWESQLCDMAVLLREINDVFEGRRGGAKHSANLKTVKAVKLDAEEQSTIAKLGLELRLLTSDMDTEVEKWEDQEHDIVRQGQSLSSMAYSMYLFTSMWIWLFHSVAFNLALS
uniref:Alpha-catulin n=1 Tax=Oncorhynchus tshawytscha TaxID=74940 RepID=A0AAZ3QJ71_ONCTS